MTRPRSPRPRRARGRSHVGERHTVEVGPVAHGGHFVARLGDGGRVVFVRHALPGERVVVEVTEGTEGDRFWRGDAVEVLEPSPDRVTPPCPYAGPGRCGGCDFQHVSLPRQRELKAEVVREQLSRLAGLAVDVVVEPVPGDPPHEHDGLRWRTRQRLVTLRDGSSLASSGTGSEERKGMRKYRSHEVIEVDDCLIAGAPADHVVRGVGFEVEDDGFWQVHPGAPEVLVDTVLSFLAPEPGESVLDLYAGVGLFARFLAAAVGDPGLVTLVEGDRRACAHAEVNVPGAIALSGDVGDVLTGLRPVPVDLVVLDPPREGARRTVVDAVAARQPRAVAYVACDPAALARDVAGFAGHGYALERLRAFDLFPMTHHVECVALLRPAS
ncbi:MAG TPA: TRAM domain-containing protein [Nocardioides sp.]|uniref:class I SAM-dependent RNA methyltransferase n=1 Tax=Nocardioides sp. TaxID=35761 RepID=UPI002E318175|nr:TRAM domain-containing protein [Nocardioides sp.]HEX5090998.1 TRAM domain-containing protein [Nocardioides sp.]